MSRSQLLQHFYMQLQDTSSYDGENKLSWPILHDTMVLDKHLAPRVCLKDSVLACCRSRGIIARLSLELARDDLQVLLLLLLLKLIWVMQVTGQKDQSLGWHWSIGHETSVCCRSVNQRPQSWLWRAMSASWLISIFRLILSSLMRRISHHYVLSSLVSTS